MATPPPPEPSDANSRVVASLLPLKSPAQDKSQIWFKQETGMMSMEKTMAEIKTNLEQVREKLSKIHDMDQIKNLLLEIQNGKKIQETEAS